MIDPQYVFGADVQQSDQPTDAVRRISSVQERKSRLEETSRIRRKGNISSFYEIPPVRALDSKGHIRVRQLLCALEDSDDLRDLFENTPKAPLS